MERLYDSGKIDALLPTQTIAATTVTGEYLNVANYRSVATGANCGPMTVGETVAVQLTQAKDRDGTDVKDITGVTATVNANTKVNEVKVTLATVGAGETLIINGLTFTAHLTVTDVTLRQFSLAGSDANDAAELMTCLTDPEYGVPNVDVDILSNVLTISAFEDVGATITAVGDTHITVQTIVAQCYIEISTDLMDHQNGFTWVGIAVTTSGTTVVGSTGGRFRARYTPIQSFAAEYLAV